MKILFWGSSDFSIPSLEILSRNHDICAVVTNPDSICGRGMKKVCLTPVKDYVLGENEFQGQARLKGIKLIQPESLKTDGFMEELALINPDLSVVVSFGMILPERILNLPRLRSINLHASLLPRYRGASPIQAALEHGDSFTGVTVQFMSKELDKGDIIMQKKVEIRPEDNYRTLSARLSGEGAALLNEAVDAVGSGNIKSYKQDDKDATFTRMLKKRDGLIDFSNLSAGEILNKWRAYYEWPGIYTGFRNSETEKPSALSPLSISLVEISIRESSGPDGPAGTILEADKKGLVIRCREGSLSLLKLKPWGKKEMDYISFINGYKPVCGRIF